MEELLKVSGEWLRIAFPWIGLAVPIVALAFPILAAFDQAKTRYMRALAVVVLFLVLCLEPIKFVEALEHQRADRMLAKLVEKLLAEEGGEGSSLTGEEKADLKDLFGDDAERLIDRLRSWKTRAEDFELCSRSCGEAARQAALAALGDVRIDLSEAFCGDAIAESERLLAATRQGVEHSLAAARAGIEKTAGQVREEWKTAAGKLDTRLADIAQGVKEAKSSVEDLDGTVIDVNTEITEFKTALTAPPDGILVSLRSNLGNVDTDVDTLKSKEEKNREYRRCLARRIWPFTLKCTSFLDEDDSAAARLAETAEPPKSGPTTDPSTETSP